MTDNQKTLIREILTKLDYLPDYRNDFLCNGKIIVSVEPMGFGYHLDEKNFPEISQTVQKLEEDGTIVFAVITGTYCFGCDRIPMNTYLLCTKEDCELYAANVEQGNDPLEGIASPTGTANELELFAYVTGIDDEYGYIHVRGRNGGLTRTA